MAWSDSQESLRDACQTTFGAVVVYTTAAGVATTTTGHLSNKRQEETQVEGGRAYVTIGSLHLPADDVPVTSNRDSVTIGTETFAVIRELYRNAGQVGVEVKNVAPRERSGRSLLRREF